MQYILVAFCQSDDVAVHKSVVDAEILVVPGPAHSFDLPRFQPQLPVMDRLVNPAALAQKFSNMCGFDIEPSVFEQAIVREDADSPESETCAIYPLRLTVCQTGKLPNVLTAADGEPYLVQFSDLLGDPMIDCCSLGIIYLAVSGLAPARKL